MEHTDNSSCCPEFDPVSYNSDGSVNNLYRVITWNDKPFVKDGTRCFFYVPLAFGRAVIRAMKKISNAGAESPKSDVMILSDCTSPWYTNIFVSSTKDEVPGAEVEKISGTFLAKAYEGDYSNMGKWVKETKEIVRTSSLGKDMLTSDLEKMEIYFHYPTCPKCAKKFGKNYVVVMAKLS